MPCSGGPSYEEELEIKYKAIQAMLCGIVSALEENDALPRILRAVDWEEAGVSRAEFQTWWRQHKLNDRQRKEEEKRAKQRKQVRARALQKLTWQEREALGLDEREAAGADGEEEEV